MQAEEIQNIYNELAQVPQSAATVATTDLGNQQAAQGALAAATTGANGVSDYTYNRLISPTVNQLTAQLVAEGKQAVLNKVLQDQINAAKKNYQSAQSNYYSRASGSGSGSSPQDMGKGNNSVDVNGRSIIGSGTNTPIYSWDDNAIRGGEWNENDQTYSLNGQQYYWSDKRNGWVNVNDKQKVGD